jgi:hypothetical protein
MYALNGPPTSSGYGPWNCKVYNNLLIRPGTYTAAGQLAADGIVFGTSGATVEPPIPQVFNNTIVSAPSNAVDVNSNVPSGFVKNNLSISSGSISVPGGVTSSNNPTTASFVNAGADDYHLTAATSPLASGTINVDIAATDFDGDTRNAGTADCGAYEYP